MPVPFDHVSKALDANHIMGGTTTTITLAPGPYTDHEVWRSWINPGFSGTFEFMEATLRFRAYATGGNSSASVTWKWQIRPEGQTSWTDLHSAVSDTFAANVERTQSVIFDASSPSAEDVPLELRLIFSTSDTDDTLYFVMSSATTSASVLRIVGVSA
jgi:hypothetical protein